MEEEFYCILKLISGEEILSLVMVDENDGDPLIILQNPITIKTVSNQQGTYLKIKSWVEMSSDDFFIIKLDKVITMTETKDTKLIDIYNTYLQDGDLNSLYDSSSSSGKVKPSSKMGYISSVEDARKKLENLFKDLKES